MKLRRVLVILFALCLAVGVMAISASAKTVASGECGADGDNVTWVLDDEGVLTVSGTGKMKDYAQNQSPIYGYRNYVKALVIESGVTSVGDWAFARCHVMESVSIPKGVESIGDYGFAFCVRLQKAVLPKGVTYIGVSAFDGCSGLESVTIPNTVTMLGVDAFHLCGSLSSVTIPDSITVIPIGAFAGCGLTSVTVPDGVEKIGARAFAYNDDLTVVTISASVNKIEGYAFEDCPNLKTVLFRGDPPQFGAAVFSGSPTTVYYPAGNDNWSEYDGYSDPCFLPSTPLKLTKQPANAAAKLGEKAKTTVKATGDGLTYTWYVKDKGSSKFTKSSLKTATYSVKMTEANNGRQVYCIVKDQYGDTVKTKTVTMRLKATVTTQPKTSYTKSGSSAKATVKAAGDGLTYTWYVKNKGATKYTKSSVTSATYSVKMSDKTKDRMVYCVLKDKYGNKVQTSKSTLRMAATVTTQPKSASAKLGAKAKVTVKAAGDGLTYTWYVKDKGATKFTKSSLKTATYSVKMTKANNGRQVYCVVKDKYGKTAKTKTVTVKVK